MTRSCVHCGASKERHEGADLLCVGSAGRIGRKFASLDLPDGKTCGDCAHIARCEAIFGHTATDTYCDFYPLRFRQAAATVDKGAL